MTKQIKVDNFINGTAKSPFNKKTKLVIFKCLDEDEILIKDIMKDIFDDVTFTHINNQNLAFIGDKKEIDMENLFVTISDDFGYNIIVHDGIYINEETSLNDIIKYQAIIEKVINQTSYTDISQIALQIEDEDYFTFLDLIDRSNFTYIYKDIIALDIIQALIKNNLNVLQTSKLLYIHRNSILNKIDIINKETGFNMQKFTNASLVNQIIKRHNK